MWFLRWCMMVVHLARWLLLKLNSILQQKNQIFHNLVYAAATLTDDPANALWFLLRRSSAAFRRRS